jgi:hypothetical protein
VSAGLTHGERPAQEFAHVESQQCGGHQAKVGEDGVSSADVRLIGERTPNPRSRASSSSPVPGIRDGDKLGSTAIAFGPPDKFPEVSEE